MATRARYLIRRQTDLDGGLLHFVMRTSRRPWVKVFTADEVPPFQGEAAWFEIVRTRGQPPRLVGPFETERG